MQVSSAKEKNSNIISIQVLRGIAAFWVVLHHSVPIDGLPDGHFLKIIVDNGFKGVQIFFVISGFIIPYSLYKSNYQYRDFRWFMTKRIVRIEPPYILSIVLCLFLAYTNTLSPWYNGPAFSINWGNTLGHLAYLNAFTGSPWINMVYWTLAIEFEFYILISILYPMLVSTNKWRQYSALVFILCCAFFPMNVRHIIYHLPFFGMGICLFLWLIEKLSAYEMAALMFLFFAEAFFNFGWSYVAVGGLTVLAIRFIKKAPKFLLFLGTISYSMYLVHSVIPTRFLALTHRFFPSLNIIIAVTICLLFIIACSYLYYLLVEKPFINISKKLKHKKPGTKPVALPLEQELNKA